MYTHFDIDKTYHPEEDFYVAYAGSEEECNVFFKKQLDSSSVNTYEIVPMNTEEREQYNRENQERISEEMDDYYKDDDYKNE